MAEAIAFRSWLPTEFQAPFQKQVLLGVIAMSLAGVFNPLLGVALFIFFLILGKTSFHRFLSKGTTGMLILFLAIYVWRPSVFLLVLFTLYFQALYFWDAKRPGHYLWITAVGFVHLAVVSTISGSVVYPVLFLGYVIILTQSLLMSNFLTGWLEKTETPGRVGVDRIETRFLKKMKLISYWIGGLSILLACVFFPFLPRFERLSYQPTQFTQSSVTGFSDEVALGEMTDIQSDNRVALRIFLPRDFPKSVQRWRGATLESWNHESQRWFSSTKRKSIYGGVDEWIEFYDKNSIDNGDILPETLRVNVSAMGRPVLFLPEFSDTPRHLSALVRGQFEQVYFSPESWTCSLEEQFSYRNFEYQIALLTDEEAKKRQPYPLDLERHREVLGINLDLTGVTDDFLSELEERANEISPDFTLRLTPPEVVAKQLELGLRRSQGYTLDYSEGKGARNLREFVVERRAGHCEYFATTLALMLRLYGVPARLVTGFQPGRSNFFGDYQIVRQSDAHSWVEAFIDGNWISLDPTPASPQNPNPFLQHIGFLADIYDYVQLQWNRHILDYSTDDQRSVIASLAGPLRWVINPIMVVGITIDLMKNTIAGLLFVLFLIWLIREIAPELGPVLQAWSMRLPGISRLRFRGRGIHLATRLFAKVEKECSRRGLTRLPGETPLRFFRRVEKETPAAQKEISRFSQLYYNARFGRADGEPALESALSFSAGALIRLVRNGG